MANDNLNGATDAPGPPPFPNMVWIPGGTFLMGSDKHYPEERPAHRVTVDGFWIDRVPVTNERFGAFVEHTGHVTFAEIPPKAEDYPARCRTNCLPGHWCSSSLSDASIRGTSRTGGTGCRVLIGDTPTGRPADSTGSSTIRLSM